MDNIIDYWNDIAKNQPFWGVLTGDKFKLSNIDKSKDEFYTSGIDQKKYIFNYLTLTALDIFPVFNIKIKYFLILQAINKKIFVKCVI